MGAREQDWLDDLDDSRIWWNLTCQLLADNTFQQASLLDTALLTINVTMPISDGDPVGCGNRNFLDVKLLKPGGAHPFAMEWVWGLKASNRSDQKAIQASSSLIIARWGRSKANQVYEVDETSHFRSTSAYMQSNTTIICSPQITTGKFRVTVDGGGRVKRSELIGELKYNDSGIFNRSTSVGNFTAQLAMLIRASPMQGLDFGTMHSDNSSHSFSQFISEYLIGKTLSDPSTPSPSFEDAQQALSKFYKRFFTVVISQNQNKIFVPAGNVSRSEVGQFESIQPRMSMDPVMFHIAVAILGFQIIAGTIISASTPGRFLPRFPYNLASEISFFYASSALSDVARTANMSSAMRMRHLKRLGGTYGYGRFKGSDGGNHVGIERMSMIRGGKEAVVATNASSAIPETMAMVRITAAVASASSSPRR